VPRCATGTAGADSRRVGQVPHARVRGFTLLELMIVVAILAIIASIAIPQYRSALRSARIVKCKQELRTISQAIDMFLATNHRLPLTLYETEFGGRRDPWGIPYCYLNYSAGAGDGLDWAVRMGLVDPSALVRNAAGRRDGRPADAVLRAPQGPVQATPISRMGRVAQAPVVQGPVVRGGPVGPVAPVASVDPAGTLASALGSQLSNADLTDLARSLGSHSMFAGIAVDSTRRRDKYLFPLNTDYDLFSLGPDGLTATALNNPQSLDDVIRANNGGFFGVASDY
jgi:general secretion pathway protein G